MFWIPQSSIRLVKPYLFVVVSLCDEKAQVHKVKQINFVIMPKMHHSTIRCEYFVLIWVFLLWFCLKSYFFHRLQIFLFENQPFPLKFVDSLEQSEQTKNISRVIKPYFFHRLQIFLYMGSIQNDHNDTYMKLSTFLWISSSDNYLFIYLFLFPSYVLNHNNLQSQSKKLWVTNKPKKVDAFWPSNLQSKF